MARRTPTILQAALTFGEARALVQSLLDGAECTASQRALLLLDATAYLLNKADLDRRKSHAIEDLGEPAPETLKEERRLDRDWPHVVRYLAGQTETAAVNSASVTT